MDIYNPTGKALEAKYDGMLYVISPGDVMPVSSETGDHLLSKLGRFGLVEARFGDDPTELSITGLRKAVANCEGAIERFLRANDRQRELHFPPLPEDPEYKLAKRALPIYKARLEELESSMDEKQAKAEQTEMESALRQAPTIPAIEDLTLEDLREKAAILGIQTDPRWNRMTLLARIREKVESDRASEDEG